MRLFVALLAVCACAGARAGGPLYAVDSIKIFATGVVEVRVSATDDVTMSQLESRCNGVLLAKEDIGTPAPAMYSFLLAAKQANRLVNLQWRVTSLSICEIESFKAHS